MNVLLYANQECEAGKRLKKVIDTLVSYNQMKICQTIEELTKKLRQPFAGQMLGVLLAADQDELEGLLSIRELLRDIRFILILPDKRKTTVSNGFRLIPRFVSYADEDFTVVAAVLCKMIENQHSFFQPAVHAYTDMRAGLKGYRS